MDRVVRRVRQNKPDTPLKNALFRRIDLKKQMGKRMYEVVPEEGELRHVRPAVLEADFGAEGSDASGSAPSLSTLSDTFCSSEEQRPPVDTSSSLPSPEVFREEHYAGRCTFRLDDDPADILPMKNSTLLDLSHAETIFMHQAPDLSPILEASSLLAEKSPEDFSPNRERSGGSKGLKAQPPALFYKKTGFLKKRVWFRSPLFSEKSKRESEAHLKPRGDEEKEKKEKEKEKEKKEKEKEKEKEKKEKEKEKKEKEKEKKEKEKEKKEKEKEKREKEKEKREKEKKEKDEEEKEIKKEEEEKEEDGGVFFDFASDSERDRFFRRTRERCVRLQNAAVFPSTAVRQKN